LVRNASLTVPFTRNDSLELSAETCGVNSATAASGEETERLVAEPGAAGGAAVRAAVETAR
jgi:hypothetical protein